MSVIERETSFVITTHGNAVHAPSCPLVARGATVHEYEHYTLEPAGEGLWREGSETERSVTLYEPLSREEAEAWLSARRGRHRCSICSPEVTEADRPPYAPRRNSGLGWPEPNGSRSVPRVPPGGCR